MMTMTMKRTNGTKEEDDDEDDEYNADEKEED